MRSVILLIGLPLLICLLMLGTALERLHAQQTCETDAECEAAYGYDMYGNKP